MPEQRPDKSRALGTISMHVVSAIGTGLMSVVILTGLASTDGMGIQCQKHKSSASVPA